MRSFYLWKVLIMVDLTTCYMGLTLKNLIVASASSLTKKSE